MYGFGYVVVLADGTLVLGAIAPAIFNSRAAAEHCAKRFKPHEIAGIRPATASEYFFK